MKAIHNTWILRRCMVNIFQDVRVTLFRATHLGSEDQLMVDNVVWSVAEAVERRGGMQEAGDARAAVDVLANALELAGVVEVGRADGLANHVPLAARGADGDLLLLHDVCQLLPHLLRLAQHCISTPAATSGSLPAWSSSCQCMLIACN